MFLNFKFKTNYIEFHLITKTVFYLKLLKLFSMLLSFIDVIFFKFLRNIEISCVNST